MAYSSDTKIKEIIKDAYRQANCKNLKARFFGESHDDAKLWEDGGLTMKVDDVEYGSCDFGFYFDMEININGKKCNESPVMLIEGTLGLEMGNTGSAQQARYNHALGPCKFGIIGVLFQAFKEPKTRAVTRWDIFQGAIKESEINRGWYLVMDIYDVPLLVELIKALDSKDRDILDSVINTCLDKMNKQFTELKKSSRKKYFHDFPIKGYTSKLYMFNMKAFTTSSARNGHTVLGETMQNITIYDDKYAILFPRLTHNDLKIWYQSNGKELKQMKNDIRLLIVTFDDFIFNDKDLEQRVIDFRYVYPTEGKNAASGIQNKKNKLRQDIIRAIDNEKILINIDKLKEYNAQKI